MNAEQAKQIPLRDFLAQLGIEPERERNGECWYFSPWRGEKEASFRVSERYNNWKDWGTGEGGDIIDFARKHFHAADAGVALAEIARVMGAAPVQARRPAPPANDEPALTITNVKIVHHVALLAYLRSRGFSLPLARYYFKEVYFTRPYHGRPVPGFALGFPNDSGGYELFNKYAKWTAGRKDISTITFADGAEDGPVCVFESKTDFLAALDRRMLPPGRRAAIVTNSAGLAERALPVIAALAPAALHLFGQNDDAGERFTDLFVERCGAACVVSDERVKWAGFKDVGALLQAERVSPARTGRA